MKISIKFKFTIQMDEYWISKQYRRGIVSLLKDLFDSAGIDLFKTNQRKPYTFSVKFPKFDKTTKTNFITSENWFWVNFSAYDDAIAKSIKSEIYKIKFLSAFGKEIYVDKVTIKEQDIITKNVILFKTFSPILVKDENGKRFLNDFNKDVFKQRLITNIKNGYEQFTTEKAGRVDVSFKKGNMTVAETYGGEIGYKGIIKLFAHSDVLQFVYESGIGNKTGQGYGMLEIL